MNIYDAAKILEISGDINPQKVRSSYLQACKKYHPDINPAGTKMMQVINEAYDELKNYTGVIEEQKPYTDSLNNSLNAIINYPGLKIEICGSWVWVTGDTQKYKEQLKKESFKWAHKKKAWFLCPEGAKTRSRGNTTLNQIRDKYGSIEPKSAGFRKIRGCA